MPQQIFYVSITGLVIRRFWHLLPFYLYATRSFRQARRAPGLIRIEARRIAGVHHTLTVWENRAAMLDFIHSGAHRRAIAAFRGMATGKTFGFETDSPPDWAQVHALWRDHGRTYG